MGSRKGTRSEAVRKGNRMRRNPAARDIRALKKVEVVRMRLDGSPYRVIAKRLDLSLGEAHALCTEALDELQTEGHELAMRLQAEQLALMDRGQMLVVRKLFNENLSVEEQRPDGSVMRLAEFEKVNRLSLTLIKYGERIAKLAGLDNLPPAEAGPVEMLNEETLTRMVRESKSRALRTDGSPRDG